MSNPIYLRRAVARAGAVIAVGLVSVVVPAAAHAAPVDLATASPFAVLGGLEVTNTGGSVLNGDLGVSPGTTTPGFGSATVNGATHVNDAVAAQAQSDLTAAYNAAAGQPLTEDLSGQDLGNKILTAGAYRYSTDALLTGTVTLDGENNPDAQFVFMIGSQLTTAVTSTVQLVRGASACNVFWQVGSNARLGTGTSFQGNLMALTAIWVEDSVSVVGRLLARNAEITLINDLITVPVCTAPTPPEVPPTPVPPTPTPPNSDGTSGQSPPASQTTVATRNGTAVWKRTPRTPGASGLACAAGFSATLRGRQIKRVVFRLDGRRIASRTKSPFKVDVTAGAGRHSVTARVTFKDATRAKTLKLPYVACAAVSLRPRQGPSRFTG